MIGKFCGDSVPAVLASSGNKMFIQFLTDDHDDEKIGFKIEYKPSPYGKV